MNDFRKYATLHLGMNGLAFDDVMKAHTLVPEEYWTLSLCHTVAVATG